MTKKTWNNNVGKDQMEYFEPCDDMEPQQKSLLFNDHSIRKSFIRKVYLILMAQLLTTFAVVSIFFLNDFLKEFIKQNPILFWPSFIVLMLTMMIMACCDEVRRQTPLNYIFLAIFTLAQSLMLAVTTCQFGAIEILLAIAATAWICLTLSLYAFQTKYDYTVLGGVLLASMVVFLIFGIFCMFFPVRPLLLVQSSIGVILFSFFLIYDTQIMMGGRHKYALSPEEYVFAALTLYLDIINLFLHILSLINFSRS